jgi:hypothetical protein
MITYAPAYAFKGPSRLGPFKVAKRFATLPFTIHDIARDLKALVEASG